MEDVCLSHLQANGIGNDDVRKRILREVYYRFLTWHTFKPNIKLPFLLDNRAEEVPDLNFFTACIGRKFTDGRLLLCLVRQILMWMSFILTTLRIGSSLMGAPKF